MGTPEKTHDTGEMMPARKGQRQQRRKDGRFARKPGPRSAAEIRAAKRKKALRDQRRRDRERTTPAKTTALTPARARRSGLRVNLLDANDRVVGTATADEGVASFAGVSASGQGESRLQFQAGEGEASDAIEEKDPRVRMAELTRNRLIDALGALGASVVSDSWPALGDVRSVRRLVVRMGAVRELLLEPTKLGVRVWLEIAEPGAPIGTTLAAIGVSADAPILARRP